MNAKVRRRPRSTPVPELASRTSRGFSEARARKLDRAEVAALRKVVAQGRDRPADVSLSRAIHALAVREPSAATATLLSRVAVDESEALVDRAVAASTLQLIDRPQARRGLVEAVSAPSGLVRIEALKALGCIGNAAELDALDRMDGVGPGPEARQLAFAKALIAHRLGRTRPDLAYRAGVERTARPDDRLIELSLRPIRPRTIAREHELMEGSAYGIELSDRVGFALQAGRARWTVFVNADLTSGGIFTRSSRIFERPWITALLSRHNDLGPTSAVQYVVLTDPAKDGATLMVVRTDGELFYSGRLARPGGMLGFMVRDIARKGTAPTNVRGRLTTRGIEFDVLIPFGTRRDKRTGEAAAGNATLGRSGAILQER